MSALPPTPPAKKATSFGNVGVTTLNVVTRKTSRSLQFFVLERLSPGPVLGLPLLPADISFDLSPLPNVKVSAPSLIPFHITGSASEAKALENPMRH